MFLRLSVFDMFSCIVKFTIAGKMGLFRLFSFDFKTGSLLQLCHDSLRDVEPKPPAGSLGVTAVGADEFSTRSKFP